MSFVIIFACSVEYLTNVFRSSSRRGSIACTFVARLDQSVSTSSTLLNITVMYQEQLQLHLLKVRVHSASN